MDSGLAALRRPGMTTSIVVHRFQFNLPFTKLKRPRGYITSRTSGEGNMVVSRPAPSVAVSLFRFALTVGASGFGGRDFVGEAKAAGAFAIGQCAAYGQAYDYPAENLAKEAALKQCKGNCTAVTMKKACAAFSVDMTNPCGPHGYAVKPKISTSLNAATRKCYEFGGKECVIRAWACDARG